MVYHGPGGGSSGSVVARRISPCFALSYASIPYVLWGEDSLNFAFNVPTALFDTVYILVPGSRLHDASSAITNRLPYKLSMDSCHHLPSSNGGTAYLPECLRLDHVKLLSPHPRQVLLISDHLLHFDTTEPQSIQKLHLEEFRPARVSEGDWIPVPTLPAYLDSLLSCNRELLQWKPAPLGWWQWFWGTKNEEESNRQRILGSHVITTFAYLLMYTFNKDARLYPDVGSIADPIKRVAVMLKEENRADFLKYFVGVDPPHGDDPWAQGFESSDSEDEENESDEGEGETSAVISGQSD